MKIKIFVIMVMLITMAPLAWSQGTFRYGSDDERAGKWDFSMEVITLGAEKISGPDDQLLAIDDDWGLGFNFGYNFTNHWALGFDFSWLSPDYELSGTTDEIPPKFRTVRHEMDIFNGQLTGTFNLLEGPFTPFVNLSAGFSYLDSNIQDGPAYCYPSYWYWGWYCYADSHDSTEFNYGGGVGVRWDINRDMFLRASYSLMIIDISASSNPELGMGRLEIGWRY